MLDLNILKSIQVNLASPEAIRAWSHGEIKRPDTINYRTFKPERDGLFCEKIFGPIRDWECRCGKYKRVKYKGIICERCGVEVTRARVRRERMGHIELAAPVSHIWYFKNLPSKIGLLLDISLRALEKVLYFASYIVIDPGGTELKLKDLLTEGQYRLARELYGANSFKVGTGAEAIQKLLMDIDLEELRIQLLQEIQSSNKQKRIHATKRLDVVKSFIKSGNKPEWMILTVLPVIPPELRPMIQLDGGRFATSDLNDLYRRVINRNNRLYKLLQLKAPEIIVRNEKRMLQEAVDALLDNGHHGYTVTSSNNRPLKSLSDIIKGKQGRFRQNLLGKRVDYSGRSVIVVGPELKLHQCGLPKEMALELFKPFVMRKIISDYNITVKAAKKKIETIDPIVWEILETVVKDHPVLLNRAPTLHRLGIQAFEPVLIEGYAIKLHPLVCTAFNADFDGDQMAVHVPLSTEAQAEARTLMMASNHLIAPKDGKPIIVPTQDMILGIYYLTQIYTESDKIFSSEEEVLLAFDSKYLELHTLVSVRLGDHLFKTSPGRIIFNSILPKNLKQWHVKDSEQHLGFLMTKKEISKLINKAYLLGKAELTTKLVDSIKSLGYHWACIGGLTVGLKDVVIPKSKAEIIEKVQKEVKNNQTLYQRGRITNKERYNTVMNLWSRATEEVGKAMIKNFTKFNPLNMMLASGARGNEKQLRQLAGMRGLMADPSGAIIEEPIKTNFREGLTVNDYFISSHGARKGLADIALRTADSGYLTRRLVDVAQDVIIQSDDCSIMTVDVVALRASMAADVFDALEILHDRLIGKRLVDGTLISEQTLIAIGESNLKTIHTDSDHVYNLSGGKLPSFANYVLGKDVLNYSKGFKPDTTFWKNIISSTIDTVELIAEHPSYIVVKALYDGKLQLESLADRLVGRVLAEDIIVSDPENNDQDATFTIKSGTLLNAKISAQIASCHDTVKVRSVLTCLSHKGVCAKCYGSDLSSGNLVELGEAVGVVAAQSIGEPGTQLTMRTFHTGGVAGGDITQGLPRVEELFEARYPKGAAILSEITGIAKFTADRTLQIFPTDPENNYDRVYNIPFSTIPLVKDGDMVEIGQPLTAGALYPHDILRTKGINATKLYLLKEVQKVYKTQGVEINDKHIEIIANQMLHRVQILESGSTEFLPNDMVDINVFEETNMKAFMENREPAVAESLILGITKVSINTDSFLSAASFQETIRVLTNAAIKGKEDHLVGLKENIIVGKLIPAGTGMPHYRGLNVIENTKS